MALDELETAGNPEWQRISQGEKRAGVTWTLTNSADGGVDGTAGSAPCVQHFVADVQVEPRLGLLGLSVHGLPVLRHIRPWREGKVKMNTDV